MIANPDIKDKNKGVVENSLKLNEIMICRGVYKRNPINWLPILQTMLILSLLY